MREVCSSSHADFLSIISSMSWATHYIRQLQESKTVQFRPRGHSMEGKISSGQLVTVEPANNAAVGDIVLCKVNGSQYLYLVTALKGNQFQISNNKGRINGWITSRNIFGRCISVTD